MSKGTIMHKGGDGSPELAAAIKTKYPLGSTCFAKTGTKTIRAEDTSGLAFFAIPTPKAFPETWTVTATDGLKTKSEMVDISKVGQLVELELSYVLNIIEAGEYGGDFEFKTATGGAAMTTTGGDNFRSLRTGAGGGGYITLPDFSVYNTLYMDVAATLTDWACIAVSTDANHYAYGAMTTNAPVLKTFSGSANRQTYALSVSSLSPTTQYYLKLYGYNAIFTLYNIWFE